MPLLGPLWVYRDSVGLSSKGAAAGLAPLNLPLGPILWLLGPVQGWLLPVRLENCSCDSHVLCMCVCVIVDLCTEQGYDSIRAGSVQQVLWKKWFWLLTSLFHYCLKVFISIIDCWYATKIGSYAVIFFFVNFYRTIHVWYICIVLDMQTFLSCRCYYVILDPSLTGPSIRVHCVKGHLLPTHDQGYK